MLSIGDALRLVDTHLGETPRASHSLFVGRLMRGLAERVGGDPLPWELTGICHDLDFEAVAGDWARHGLVSAEWLKDDLPPEALEAIRAHDHRTGIVSSTPIAHALKLADAVAISRDHIGTDLLLSLAANDDPEIVRRLNDRPYLPAMLFANAASLGVSLPALARILTAAALTIETVTPDTPGFADLSRRCSHEGHRMLERFEANWLDGSNRFNQLGEQAFGASLDGNLVALCGRNRDPYDPSPRAGRVRHLYVDVKYRRLGIGRLMIDSVIDGAAEWFDHLNTNCPPEAAAFYERRGFVPIIADRTTHRLNLSRAKEQP